MVGPSGIDLRSEDFRARFRKAFFWRQEAAGLTMEVIAAAIGRSDRILWHWLSDPGDAARSAQDDDDPVGNSAGQARKRPPSPRYVDVEQIHLFFADLGHGGMLDELVQTAPRWCGTDLSFLNPPLPPGMAVLAEGLQQTSLDPVAFLEEKGWARKAHVLDFSNGLGGPLVMRHVGADIPLSVPPDVATRDLRVGLRDHEFARLLYNQLLVIRARRRPAFNKMASDLVAYDRLTIPVGETGLVCIPHNFMMQVPKLALD